MKKIIAVTLAGLASVFTFTASATGVGPSKVTDIYIQANGVAFFLLEGSGSVNWPGCATTRRFAINTADAGGRRSILPSSVPEWRERASTLKGMAPARFGVIPRTSTML